MRIPRLHLALIFTAAFALTANTLRAVPLNPTFSFHENGEGFLELPNGVTIPIPGTLASDPGPGGLLSALAFTTHPQESPFVVGDVVLLDENGAISDILRFNPATSNEAGLTQLIFFYSNDSGGLLADTGLPAALYANALTIFENERGATTYTPVAGKPGFEAGFPLPITYQIFSTPDMGSTLPLLGAAISGLALLRRKILA